MIDRVATNAQAQAMVAQIMQATNALNQSQTQVSSGLVSTDYAGLGDKTATLEAARSAAARTDSYQAATQLALNQTNLQDTQLTSLSDLANQLQSDITSAAGNGDASELMTQAQGIFDQATQIMNSKDANGNYLYGGDKDNTPPVTVSSLSDLTSLSSASDAFANGTVKRTVAVGDGQSVQIGLLASDMGTQLMQTLKSIADFNAGSNGPFGSTVTTAQSNFLTGAIQGATDAATAVNNVDAQNGMTYQRLQDESSQQQSLSTLYKGFVSDIQDVDMGTAVANLNQNQVALQAALQVTSQLNQVSLLNYLNTSSTTG
jgi:flagellar hook-associated protein 3 FlgL